MSYTVDGRTYHDWDEYQRAQNRYNARLAQERAQQAEREVQRYQNRIREQQIKLDQARGDLKEQQKINQQIRADVSAMQQEQQRFAQAQREFEGKATEQMNQMQSELSETQEQLDQAEKLHNEFVQETRKTFEETDAQIKAGLENAEKQLEASEERLKTEINTVNDKLDKDIQQRLETKQGQLDQAGELLKMTEEVLDKLQSELMSLNLEEISQSTKVAVQQARVLVQQGMAEAALAQASGAFTEARNLQYLSQKRSSELEVIKSTLRDRIDYLKEQLNNEGLERCFAVERAEMLSIINNFDQRLQTRYQQYSRKEIFLDNDSRILNALEEEASIMLASVKNVDEQYEIRSNKATRAIENLARVYGGVPQYEGRLADENDIKSPLIVDCKLAGGVEVNFVALLNGDINFQAVAHDSQSSCERAAIAVANSFKDNMQVNHEVQSGNPQQISRAESRKDTDYSKISENLKSVNGMLK